MTVLHDYFSDFELSDVRDFLRETLRKSCENEPEFTDALAALECWQQIAFIELMRRAREFAKGVSTCELVALANGQLDLPAELISDRLTASLREKP